MWKRIILVLVAFGAGVGWADSYVQWDRLAKNAPLSVADSPRQLVSYLTKNATTETQKARVLAAWMVYQVQRDGYRRKVLIRFSNKNLPAPKALDNHTFQTRIGTSQDFASLYQELCALAGLQAVIIDGFVGNDIQAFRYNNAYYQAAEVALSQWLGENNTLQRYRASWNAVKINDTWRLVDTYKMIANDDLYVAQDIQTEAAMKRFLKKRQEHTPRPNVLAIGKHIDNAYFFAKPNQFVKTHFPLDSKWQLLAVPRTWATFVGRTN